MILTPILLPLPYPLANRPVANPNLPLVVLLVVDLDLFDQRVAQSERAAMTIRMMMLPNLGAKLPKRGSIAHPQSRCKT